MKISVNFESKDHPNLISIKFKRKITNSLCFTGLEGAHINSIKDIFKQLDIPINTITYNDETILTPQGGKIINGNSVSVVGIRADLSSFRTMFPGKTDDELQKLFG